MLIYIRHSEENDSDPTHELDPKLTEKGKSLAQEKGKYLTKKYGCPDIIYCSPFRRTRQTLKYMLRHVSSKEFKNIKIIYDTNSSRFFHRDERSSPDIARSTLKYKIPIYEDRQDFKQRVENLTTKLNKLVKSEQVVWCITHTTVYKKLATIYDVDIPQYVPFMHHFKIIRLNNRRWCSNCNAYHMIRNK